MLLTMMLYFDYAIMIIADAPPRFDYISRLLSSFASFAIDIYFIIYADGC